MKLRYEQLGNQLKQGFSPVYFISGDEPLLLQQAKNQIIEAAQQQGYSDKSTFQIDHHFHWHEFVNEANTLSLFDSKRILDCRLTSAKLNDAGSKALQAYVKNPAPDRILLLSTSKLETATQSSAWFRAIDQHGIIIQIWPLTLQQLPTWLSQRLQQKGLRVSAQALQQLVAFSEGNLLAADQAIEKLHLLFGSQSLSDEQVTTTLIDSAAFDIFNLVDTCLQGDGKRVIRVLNSLLKSGVEPTLIAWALLREIRSLVTLLHGAATGKSLQELFNAQRIMEKRKPLIQRALKRLDLIHLYRLLRDMRQIDTMIKGALAGNVENELTTVCLALAGISIIQAANN